MIMYTLLGRNGSGMWSGGLCLLMKRVAMLDFASAALFLRKSKGFKMSKVPNAQQQIHIDRKVTTPQPSHHSSVGSMQDCDTGGPRFNSRLWQWKLSPKIESFFF